MEEPREVESFDTLINKRCYLARFSGEDAQDLAQEMRIATWISLRSYDPTRGKKLDNYIHKKLDWVIKRYRKKKFKDIPKDADGNLIPLISLDNDLFLQDTDLSYSYLDKIQQESMEHDRSMPEPHLEIIRDIEVENIFKKFISKLSPIDQEIIKLLMSNPNTITHNDISDELSRRSKEFEIDSIARPTVTKRINKLKEELRSLLYEGDNA